MRIATFNVNNVVKRLPNLLDWLAREQPDVACLQELKATDEAFPIREIEAAGYGAVWKGQKSWNGVAILARGGTPVATRYAMPGDTEDAQARYVEAAVGGVLIASIYQPNGNPVPGPKFAYKLAWFERLIAHAQTLLDAGVPAVLAGDFNVVPTDFDIYKVKKTSDAVQQPEPKAAWKRLLAQGWTDSVRALHPAEPMFSFWDYFRNAWQRDAGMRLDAILLSPDLAPRLKAAGVHRWVRGEPNASDHAPVWAELAQAGSGSTMRKVLRR